MARFITGDTHKPRNPWLIGFCAASAAIIIYIFLFYPRYSLEAFFIGGTFIAALLYQSGKSARLYKNIQEILAENYESAKMLVQRDRELVAANEELRQRNKESDETAKILIRRDLELTEANARLQELDAIKSEFVSVAAHQLRTPLTGIRWSYTMLLEKGAGGSLNPEQRKIAEEGLGATMRAIELVNNLLDTARIEEGRFGFNLRLRSLAPVIQKIYTSFVETAKEKGIRFSLQMPAREPPPAFIDDEKIIMLLDNLLDNAIRYTSPGGSVYVRLAKQGEQIRIDVEDTGIGIPREQAHRVFTKFFRGDNAQLFETSGTGLGLYVSKNIAEKHGGALSFESVENKGTTFTLTLPIPKRKKVKNSLQ
ncbi:MAG: HAMP domain-containing sensor histidine kinase [Patescibacteria group bacterium]